MPGIQIQFDFFGNSSISKDKTNESRLNRIKMLRELKSDHLMPMVLQEDSHKLQILKESSETSLTNYMKARILDSATFGTICQQVKLSLHLSSLPSS